MTSPINLNKARKAKAKTAKTAQSALNRAKFGQSKAEKAAEQSRLSHQEKTLKGKKLETPAP